MGERTVPVATGMEICCETFGDPAGDALLLVSGLGGQMIGWDERFCRELAGRGFFVIRYDNRDVGRSTWLDHLGSPDLAGIAAGTSAPPYTLNEMAADGMALLTELGVESAHVVGISMGGMIGQLMAIEHPSRVLSLTSIMSNFGGPDVVTPAPGPLGALLAAPPADREGAVEHALRVAELIGGPSFEPERARAVAERAYDRGFHPAGRARQYAAIVAQPDRRPRLRELRVQALVVHGKEDPLVPFGNGELTAEAIPGARTLFLDGMGHNLPEWSWAPIAGAIAELAGQPSRR